MRYALAVPFVMSLVACSLVVDPDTSRLGGDPQRGADGGPSASCPSHQRWCSGSCVSIESDDRNCGSCGVQCALGEECAGGSCTCASDDCAPVVDECASCRADQSCVDGRCACGGGLTDLGGVCVDLASDPENCGAAGVRCESGICADGDCACAAGLRECRSQCVDVATDELHCGRCNHDCDGDELCHHGECRGYELGCADCDGDDRSCCLHEGTAICLRASGCL